MRIWGYYIIRIVTVILVALDLIACGITLSPIKRKPLQIGFIEIGLPQRSEKILVHYLNTIPNNPLDETVWDNISGPLWDIRESQQIGFTQNYEKLILSSAVAGAAGGATGVAVGGGVGGIIGGSAAASSMTKAPGLVDTRIVIPFGRIFTTVFQSGLNRSFSSHWICFDDQCTSETAKSKLPDLIMDIRITDFYVWESPTNHINLKASIVARIQVLNKDEENTYVYEVDNQIEKYKIATVLSTSSRAIREMNYIANKFAEDLSVDILTKGIK